MPIFRIYVDFRKNSQKTHDWGPFFGGKSGEDPASISLESNLVIRPGNNDGETGET
jgi:hypothetical protein